MKRFSLILGLCLPLAYAQAALGPAAVGGAPAPVKAKSAASAAKTAALAHGLAKPLSAAVSKPASKVDGKAKPVPAPVVTAKPVLRARVQTSPLPVAKSNTMPLHPDYGSLPDPTKPAVRETLPVSPVVAHPVVKKEDDEERTPVIEVQSIKVADGEKLAIINGEVHKIGDHFGAYTLSEMDTDTVTLVSAKRQVRLPVMPTLSKLIRGH